MNCIRTIQSKESPLWMLDLFFGIGFHPAGIPLIPISFPFPHKIKSAAPGNFLYIVFQGVIVGYSCISDIRAHSGIQVGSDSQDVEEGETIVCGHLLQPFPFRLTMTGFQGIRYCAYDLHLAYKTKAQRAKAQRWVDSINAKKP